MPTHIQHPQWRKQLEPTKYPFADRATMTNGEDVVLEGLFLDAALYPIGGGSRLFMSRVVITHQTATVTIASPGTGDLASGEFELLAPPDVIKLLDPYGRPAGVLVSDSSRLSLFQGWGVGTHEFQVEDTEFVSRVSFPTPEQGVRGIVLVDGTVLTGQVWLVGGAGVVLRQTSTINASPVGYGDTSYVFPTIRVDVVGDPLFRRRLCRDAALFDTPQFLRTVTFADCRQAFVCSPDEYGDVKMTVNNDLAEDTVLRIRSVEDGILFEAVGSKMESVRRT